MTTPTRDALVEALRAWLMQQDNPIDSLDVLNELDRLRAAAETPEGPSEHLHHVGTREKVDVRRPEAGEAVRGSTSPDADRARLLERLKAYAETRGRVEDADGFLFEDAIALLSTPSAPDLEAAIRARLTARQFVSQAPHLPMCAWSLDSCDCGKLAALRGLE